MLVSKDLCHHFSFKFCFCLIKPDTKGYKSFPGPNIFMTALSFVLVKNNDNTVKASGSKFPDFVSKSIYDEVFFYPKTISLLSLRHLVFCFGSLSVDQFQQDMNRSPLVKVTGGKRYFSTTNLNPLSKTRRDQLVLS